MESVNLLNNCNALKDKPVNFINDMIKEEYNAFQKDENKRKMALQGLAWLYLILLLTSIIFLGIVIF